MSFLKTTGVIIKEYKTKEADKNIVVLTPYHGKIEIWAKGARRPKSPLVGKTQLFNYCEFNLFKSGDSYTINSCEIVESFQKVKDDIDLLYHAVHMADIIDSLVQEGENSTDILSLFLNALYVMAGDKERMDIVTRIFELRTLGVMGYTPAVDSCNGCGSKDVKDMYFDFDIPGFLCSNCKNESSIELESGCAYALNYIFFGSPSQIIKLGNFR